MSNTKLVKYYKKLMKGVSKEESRYEYIIEAYEQRIKQLQTEKRGVRAWKTKSKR